MVTHTREPVVNCRTNTGKTLNAKHQKTDVTIRVKTRDIENHFDYCSVYDKCVVADLLMNNVKKLPFTSIKLDQSFELATSSVKKSFLEKKKDELDNLATNINHWSQEIYKNITETSSKDILILLDFIWFYPDIPIEFIPTACGVFRAMSSFRCCNISTCS